jgi:DMSO/TMAO reductase YedYZ molybdopterin-dependent catalytic subunit
MGAAVGIVTVATVGQTVAPLAPLALLAPRRPDIGPQGLPVNRSARGAGVTVTARDPGYRLTISGPRTLALSLADLEALPQHTVELPITCVEGWSATATWTGVRIRDLLDAAGVDPSADVLVESLQRGGTYRTSVLAPPHHRDPLTLLALQLGGEPLDLDHGYPCRLIAPNRPGVLQTKWVARLTVAP